MKIYFYPCTLDYFLSDNSEKQLLFVLRQKYSLAGCFFVSLTVSFWEKYRKKAFRVFLFLLFCLFVAK